MPNELKPWHRRWPGEHAFKCIWYDPKRTRIQVETRAEPGVAEAFKYLMLIAVTSQNSPRLTELCQELVAECERLLKVKKKA